MIYLKTAEEVEIIRENCMLVSKTLAHVGSLIRPGITGNKLDEEAETFIRDFGAEPGFKGYKGFPASLCISPNAGVVHGIPSDEELQEGDIVSIDCGVYKNEFYGDAAYTFAVGEIEQELKKLMAVTKKALELGLEQARDGNRTGDIGHAVQQYAERRHKYGVIRELCGHGLGRDLHEPPDVPNYGKKGKGIKLRKGMVLAIEPMINLKRREIRQLKDGWTIVSRDGSPSAHFEHSLVITEGDPDILSDHSIIRDAIKKNPEVADFSIKN